MTSLLLLLAVVGFLGATFMNPFIGVLAYSYISLMNPHQIVYGVISGLPYALMTFSATMLAFLVSKEPKRIPFSLTLVVVLAFMAWITLSSVAGMAADVWEKWNLTIKLYVFMLMGLALATNKVRIHALVWAFVIALGIWGARGGIFSLLSGGGGRVFGPASTMIADNNHLGVAILVTIPLTNYLRLQSANRLVRLGLIGLMVVCIIAVLCTYSRGAMIGLVAMSLMFWWRSKKKIITGIVGAATMFAALAFVPQAWYDRMNSVKTYEEDASSTDRLDMWYTSTVMANRRLTGGGFMGPYRRDVVDQFDRSLRARAVHSIYFEVIGEHGWPGFAIWLMMPIVAWMQARWVLRRTRREPNLQWANELARMSQTALIAYLVGGTFLSLSYWEGLAVLLVIIAATRTVVGQELAARVRVRAPGQGATATPSISARPGRSQGFPPRPIPLDAS